MTSDRVISLVEDRPGVQHRFDIPEDLLHLPQLLVFERYGCGLLSSWPIPANTTSWVYKPAGHNSGGGDVDGREKRVLITYASARAASNFCITTTVPPA